MRRVLFWLLILLLMTKIVSCCGYDPHFMEWHNEASALHICASYAVTGSFYPDVKGKVTEILEKDCYGRILFKYYCRSYLAGEQAEAAVVICQKYDNDYVYYYEDVCYINREYSEEDIAALKAVNDWDKPLNEGLMSRRWFKTTLDGVVRTEDNTGLSYDTIRDLVCDALSIDRNMLDSCGFVDNNTGADKVMYYVKTSCDALDIKTFLVIIDSDRSVGVLPIENNIVSSTEIAEFKAQCGWKHGFN